MTVHEAILRRLMSTVDRLVGRTMHAADAGVDFLVGFAVVYALGRLVAYPMVTRALSVRRVQPTIERAVLKTVTAVVFVVAVVAGLSFAGATRLLAPTAMLTAALTLAVGFAAQDVLGNLVSGVFIVADPKFNIGDFVRWSDREGTVEDISFRVTRIRGRDGELVTVPNAELANTSITNLDAADRHRLTQRFEVSYDDLAQVRELVREAAESTETVFSDPAPAVRVVDFGDVGVRIEAQFWVAAPHRSDPGRVRSTFLRRVHERFDAAGVDIPDPGRRLTGDITVAPPDDAGTGGDGTDVPAEEPTEGRPADDAEEDSNVRSDAADQDGRSDATARPEESAPDEEDERARQRRWWPFGSR